MTARVLMVVEDDTDIRFLVRIQFGADPDFSLDGEAADATAAIETASQSLPDLIVLDHLLEGPMTGFQAAPLLKAASPTSKIILFTASEELREPAKDSPSIDAFLLKTEIERLLPMAKRLLA
ncbi:MAG: response regulator, partial [Acidimicrobiales bacterium]